jgi:hypothetical protein
MNCECFNSFENHPTPSAHVPSSNAYAFNEIVPDVRRPASISGGSACPVPSHIRTGAPSYVWTGVAGSTRQYVPPSITCTATQYACGSDGVNSICFAQADLAFTPGVLAFTRVIAADQIGLQLGTGAPSTEVGEILDADIYFNPSDSSTTYATPSALVAAPAPYDLESLLIHELGHSLGFSHSAVWSAMMFPFAPTPGTFTGSHPTLAQPDAPLGEDDRTGLRVLYPDPSDTLRVGSIGGRIVNANPLSLPITPAGVTGVFGSHVVAVDVDSG